MLNLHLDMPSGIAGDMTVAALTHLGAPLEPLQHALKSMGLEKIRPDIQKIQRNGISCLSFRISGMEHRVHHHRCLEDILLLISKADMDPEPRDMATEMFEKLAVAEGTVHDKEPAEVAFHEAGAEDSIADIVGVSLAIHHLSPGRITASTPVLGSGVTKSQHGIIPVPSPATVGLLKGIETQGLDTHGELTTPTGAAILATVVDQFGPWPMMKTTAIGYGAGVKEFPDRPNLLRAVLGEIQAPDQAGDEWQIDTNIDDMNPEFFELLIEKLFESGANDVWLTPVYMKKHRPAVTVSVLCDAASIEPLQRSLFTHSSTIGLRFYPLRRRKLARSVQTVETQWGNVRMKIASEGQTIYSASPEYDDCKAIARRSDIPINKVYSAAQRAWQDGQDQRE